MKVSFSYAEREVFRPREWIQVSEWAEKYRFVPRGRFKGRWRNSISPYLVKPMDCFSNPMIRKIGLQFAPQTGKTAFAQNCLMYAIDQEPGSALYVMADEKSAKRISRRQIIPAFKQTPKISRLLSPKADNTSTLLVSFINGMDLMLGWSTSPAVLASESCRYVFLDEAAKYPDFSAKESDPFSLAEVRTVNYPDTSKILYFSTPNTEEDAFDTLMQTEFDEVYRYHCRCPLCDHLQEMLFESINWPADCRDPRAVMRKKLARYTCVNCGMDWDDYLKNKAVDGGHWICDDPVSDPIAVGFGPLPSWISKSVSLSAAASAFLKGVQNPKKWHAFFTQHKAIAWSETIEEKDESEILKHRSELPEGVVPEKALALTCGIDVQKVGFWFVVRAWEMDLTSHLIHYGYLSTFQDIIDLVYGTVYKCGEREFRIWRCGIDTGGGETDEGIWTRTEEIYMFVRENGYSLDGRQVICAVKGASRPQFRNVNAPTVIDKLPRSNKSIPGGLELRTIDTFELKKILHWRLTRKEAFVDNQGEDVPAESQRTYLHASTGMDYAKQFLGEKFKKDRNGKWYWHKTRDNHLLDCEVMAAACADSSWSPSLHMLANMQQKQAAASPPKQAPAASNNKWIRTSGRWI